MREFQNNAELEFWLRIQQLETTQMTKAKYIIDTVILRDKTKDVLFWNDNGTYREVSEPSNEQLQLCKRIQKLEIALTEIAYMTRRPSNRPSGGAQISLSASDMAEIANEALSK